MEMREIVGLTIVAVSLVMGGITLFPMLVGLYRREFSGAKDDKRLAELEDEIRLLREQHSEDMEEVIDRIEFAERLLQRPEERAIEKSPVP